MTYTDKDLNINNTYHYKIKAILKNGKHSLMSKELIVNVD
jgi:hypothetical protein